MSWILPLLLGIVIGGFCLGVFAIGIVVLVFFLKMRNTHLFAIRHIHKGGSFTIERVVGRPMLHPKLGEVYYVSSLKAQKRQYIPIFGRSLELPLRGGMQRYFVPLAYYNNTYAPESVQTMVKDMGERIEIVQDAITKKPVAKIIKEEIERPIIKPLAQSMRQFHLFNDAAINDEYKADKSWIEQWGPWIGAALIIFVALIFAVMVMVFGMQAASNMPSLETFSETVAARTAEILGNQSNTTNAPPTVDLPFLSRSEATP